jgi:hypothetical protein
VVILKKGLAKFGYGPDMKVEILFETIIYLFFKRLLHLFNVLGYLAAGTFCKKIWRFLLIKKMKSSELGPIFSQK